MKVLRSTLVDPADVPQMYVVQVVCHSVQGGIWGIDRSSLSNNNQFTKIIWLDLVFTLLS